MSSVTAVRAQATASAPAKKSFNGVAIAKGSFKNQRLVVSRRVATQAAAAPVDPKVDTTYEVELTKPIKVKFARGNDGGAYVVQVPDDPLYADFEIADKIVEIRCVIS
jgi:hypothetical protein